MTRSKSTFLWRHIYLPLQVIYFTATFPYLVLIILLVRGVTLDGYMKGLEFYLVPKFDKLADPRVRIMWITRDARFIYLHLNLN